MLRRNFLKALGLLNVAGLWPARAAERLDPAKATAASVRLTGTVTSAGRGLAGVAITDGFSVVPTDARGRYDFAAHSEARFVYLSLPAGHRVPHVNGLARFFEAIPPSQSVHTADFELQPSPESDVKHGFIVWADPQIRNKRHAELLLGTTTPDLKAFAQGFPRDYFHGLGCGDLVWDDLSLFPDYREAVARTGLTFFNLIGNHDLDLAIRLICISNRMSLEADHSSCQIKDLHRSTHIEHEDFTPLRQAARLQNKLGGLRDGHEITGDFRVRDGHRTTAFDLFLKQRYYRA